MTDVGWLRTMLVGVLIWSGSLFAYCLLQTAANMISVQIQDYLLLALPVVLVVTVVFALRAGPPLQLALRVALGGVAAWAFGGLYQVYFREVIVDAFHIWDRHEGNLQPILSLIGFLVLVGVFTTLVFVALFGARRRVQA
jgi:hypothetical protein